MSIRQNISEQERTVLKKDDTFYVEN